MMLAEDIRAIRRLERNKKRLAKAIALLRSFYKENDIAELDIGLCIEKLRKAEKSVDDMRKRY